MKRKFINSLRRMHKAHVDFEDALKSEWRESTEVLEKRADDLERYGPISKSSYEDMVDHHRGFQCTCGDCAYCDAYDYYKGSSDTLGPLKRRKK